MDDGSVKLPQHFLWQIEFLPQKAEPLLSLLFTNGKCIGLPFEVLPDGGAQESK